jgi:SM-20-related protein
MLEVANQENTWPLRLFSKLGVFIRPNFFDPQLCAQILTEMQNSVRAPATITRDGVEYLLDEDYRKAHRVEMPKASVLLVVERLKALESVLEDYFKLALKDLESPQFLQYSEGDYFRPHRDNASGSGHSSERKISIVVFLNGSKGGQENSYAGGALTLYGLIKDQRFKDYGMALKGETGLLVAFRSETFHEVELITNGLRHTIVSWFS